MCPVHLRKKMTDLNTPSGDDPAAETAAIMEELSTALKIHAVMLARLMEGKHKLTLELAEALEDIGNRYLDFSELISCQYWKSKG